MRPITPAVCQNAKMLRITFSFISRAGHSVVRRVKMDFLQILLILSLAIAQCLAAGPGLQLPDALKQHLQTREGWNNRRKLGGSLGATDLTEDLIPKFPLPSSLEPLNYNVRIRPILDQTTPDIGQRFSAPGTVIIRMNCIQDTTDIVLHSYLLDINNATIVVVNTTDGTRVPILETFYAEDKHFYNIKVEGLVAGNVYEVDIDFVAPVSQDRVNGLYLTSYADPETGEPRYMAATQLEPARARQVFPCFDEPRFKPTFDVIIGRMENYTSLANSPLLESQNDQNPGWVWDVYNRTVPMPAYLFAMAVTFNYDCQQADESLYRMPIQTCAAKHLIDQGLGTYSADASAQIMQFFEDHYELDFPMDKIDSIVVPGKGGAMENYGLITYGDFLLYYVNETSESQRQRLVNVIAHELAHQWFGNLVTCVSWSHIYLNEGFASYVSFVGEDEFYPEFFPREYILNDAVQPAFIQDAGRASHPLVVEDIYTIDKISSHFSNLQYDKGASIIRMMEGFLTEDTLNNGLREYLRQKEHQVAEQDELFAILTTQAHSDGTLPDDVQLKDIMDTWTLQNGFPLVRVSRWDADNIYISQERFRNQDQASPSENEVDTFDYLWEIPISTATQDRPNFQNYTPATWIPKNIIAKIFRHDTSKWIMLNPDGMNFYRVMYDERMLSLIREQLRTNHVVISPLSRSQLIDDYLNLAWQRYVNVESALELTDYLAKEDHFTVWNAFFTGFRSAFQILSSSEAPDSVKEYLLPRLAGALNEIGLRHQLGDKGALVLLRAQLLDWACSLGHEDCLTYTNELLQNWQQNPNQNPFQVDLQPVLYCTAIANGDAATADFFIEKYMTMSFAEHKSRIVSALACANDSTLIDELLVQSLNATSGFSKPDSSLLLQRFALNQRAHEKLFNALQTHLEAIINFHGSAVPVANVITLLSGFYSTSEQLNQVRDYVAANSDAFIEVQPQLDTALVTIEANIRWRVNFYDRIQRWFNTHV